MAENGGKQAFGVGAGQREFVGVADAGGLDLDQHLAIARAFELNGSDFQRLAGSDSNGGANVHKIPHVWCRLRAVQRAAPRNSSLPLST
ncbi:hypothetical protein V1282_001590 [Nitrobacteraceae bacterium AZCC 2146]